MSTAKKILVVSKDNHFINTLENNLSKDNFQMKSTKARDEELIKILVDTAPDLTIMDTPLVCMESIRQLLGIRDARDVPVLILSTEGSKADTVRTLSLGSYSRPMIKPITFEQLLAQINNLLNKSAAAGA